MAKGIFGIRSKIIGSIHAIIVDKLIQKTMEEQNSIEDLKKCLNMLFKPCFAKYQLARLCLGENWREAESLTPDDIALFEAVEYCLSNLKMEPRKKKRLE